MAYEKKTKIVNWRAPSICRIWYALNFLVNVFTSKKTHSTAIKSTSRLMIRKQSLFLKKLSKHNSLRTKFRVT